MIPQQDGPMTGAVPTAPTGAGAPGASSLAASPGQASALGGSPVGLSGASDPQSVLAKAQLLLKSGAITQQQFQMILAKLQAPQGGARPGGGAPAPGQLGQPPGSPLSTTGVPGAGPPPPPQWNQ